MTAPGADGDVDGGADEGTDEGATGERDPALEAGRRLFAQPVRFVTSAAGPDQVPATALPEIAFAGRSNVGKSSLINALTGRRDLAFSSKTPGRTRLLNFFELGGRAMLVDLPGHGFARRAKTEIAAWQELTRAYLRGRPQLRRVLLLVDARHGLKDNDREIIELMRDSAVPVQIVLTKADKAGTAACARRAEAITAELARNAAIVPGIPATSAVRGQGLAELRAEIGRMAGESG